MDLRVPFTSETSTYKLGLPDIPLKSENPGGEVKPLSEYSNVVKGLRSVALSRLYCRKQDVDEAQQKIVRLRERA